MAKPQRRSLSDRNKEAIAARSTDQTAGERSEETPAPMRDEAPQEPAARPQPSDPAVRRAPSAPASRSTQRRSSVYLDEDEERDARSAYLVDFDHRPGSAGSFGRWASDAVVEFAGLSVKQRQQARATLGPPGTGPQKSPKLLLDDDVIAAVDEAMRQDRQAGVVDRSASAFYAYALRWQSAQALKRSGLAELPAPPDRLPILYRR